MTVAACPRCRKEIAFPLPEAKPGAPLRCPHCGVAFKMSSKLASAIQDARMSEHPLPPAPRSPTPQRRAAAPRDESRQTLGAHLPAGQPLAKPVVVQATGEEKRLPTGTIIGRAQAPTSPPPVRSDPATLALAARPLTKPVVAQATGEPGERPSVTTPLVVETPAPAPSKQAPPASPPPLATGSAVPSRPQDAARSDLADDQGTLDASEFAAVVSPVYRAWASARSVFRSARSRVGPALTALGRKVKSSLVPLLPADRNRLRLVLIAASCAVIAFVIAGLLLRSARVGNAKRPVQNGPTLAAVRPTAPPVPPASAVNKPAPAIPAAVALLKGPPAAPEPTTAKLAVKNSSSRHAKTSSPRRKMWPHKVAHAAGASERTKRQERVRLGQNSAATRDGSTRTAAAQASVADPATRSRQAYKEGNASLFSGQTEAAIKAYQEAVRLNRKDPAGYRGLGLAYAQAGRRTEAASAFQRYLKLARTAKDRDIIMKRIQLLTSH